MTQFCVKLPNFNHGLVLSLLGGTLLSELLLVCHNLYCRIIHRR